MAERRMFAKTIVLSDDFQDMSNGAKVLYFNLGMYADDDGIVNSPKSVMRSCGTTVKEMHELLDNKFVLNFGNVVVVKHWKINNFIRGDRYKPTKYEDIKNQLYIDANGAYSLHDGDGIPNIGQPSIEEVSEGKSKKEKINYDAEIVEVINYLNDKTGKHFTASDVHAKLIRGRLKEKHTVEDFKKVIDVKCGQWYGNPNMIGYLRPQTLFSASHFESYLNEYEGGGALPIGQGTSGAVEKYSDSDLDRFASELGLSDLP